jgi:hypothetical protein
MKDRFVSASRRLRVLSLCAPAAAASPAATPEAPPAAQTEPDILIIYIDDLGCGGPKDLAGKYPEKYAGLEAKWKSWNRLNEKARREDKRSGLRQGIMCKTKK